MSGTNSDELGELRALLPAPDQMWLCVVFGSAARGALGPESDIDVVAEGDPDALETWVAAAEASTGREVDVSGPTYHLSSPLILSEILENHVVLRDSRARLDEIRHRLDTECDLETWQLMALREAVDDPTERAPGRPLSPEEARFIAALGKVRNERKRLLAADKSLERQWATQRLLRGVRNLLRDWPECGDYVQPRAVLKKLAGHVSTPTLSAIAELPFESAPGDSADPKLDPKWAVAETVVVPVLDDLLIAATRSLRERLDG